MVIANGDADQGRWKGYAWNLMTQIRERYGPNAHRPIPMRCRHCGAAAEQQCPNAAAHLWYEPTG